MVIASGSTGNAVRIENIMIDCGIPFSRMREELYKVDTLLITHSHSDHLKLTTLQEIRKEFPRIKVIANSDVAYIVDVDTVVGTAPVQLKKKRTVIPFECHHDVECTGYIIQMDGLNILYATDTYCMDDMEIKLDYCFLESNYDEVKIKAMSKQYAKGSYNPCESVFRHLSTRQCKEFYYAHRRNKGSVLIELHKSSRFY